MFVNICCYTLHSPGFTDDGVRATVTKFHRATVTDLPSIIVRIKTVFKETLVVRNFQIKLKVKKCYIFITIGAASPRHSTNTIGA